LEGAPEVAAGTQIQGSAGAKLRAAREAAGLHIAMLATTLKVPQAKLEALEADRWDALPDATFARALAKAVCRALKIDSADVLGLLPVAGEATLEGVSRGLNQPFKAQMMTGERLSLEWLKRPVMLVPLALLLAALAVSTLPVDWLQSTWRRASQTVGSSKSETPPSHSAESDASASVVPVESTVLSPMQASVPLDAASVPVVSMAAAASGPTLVPGPAQTSGQATLPSGVSALAPAVAKTAPVVESVAASAATKPSMAASTDLAALKGAAPLKLKTHAESWIEVVDARGQVLLSKLMRPGDQAELQVLPPVKLRIGNVSGTELSLRGETVDLNAKARDNVARLELQ